MSFFFFDRLAEQGKIKVKSNMFKPILAFFVTQNFSQVIFCQIPRMIMFLISDGSGSKIFDLGRVRSAIYG